MGDHTAHVVKEGHDRQQGSLGGGMDEMATRNDLQMDVCGYQQAMKANGFRE